MPQWAVLAIAAIITVLAAAVLIPSLAGAVGGAAEPAPTPTPTPTLPGVPGDLGVHLEQLEEAVTP